MIEWKWFCIMWSGRKGGWGLGFEFAVSFDYAFISLRVLNREVTLQWEKDVEYVRG